MGDQSAITTLLRKVQSKPSKENLQQYEKGIIHPLLTDLVDDTQRYLTTSSDEDTALLLKRIGGVQLAFKRHVGAVCNDCEQKYDIIVDDAQNVSNRLK